MNVRQIYNNYMKFTTSRQSMQLARIHTSNSTGSEDEGHNFEFRGFGSQFNFFQLH